MPTMIVSKGSTIYSSVGNGYFARTGFGAFTCFDGAEWGMIVFGDDDHNNLTTVDLTNKAQYSTNEDLTNVEMYAVIALSSIEPAGTMMLAIHPQPLKNTVPVWKVITSDQISQYVIKTSGSYPSVIAPGYGMVGSLTTEQVLWVKSNYPNLTSNNGSKTTYYVIPIKGSILCWTLMRDGDGLVTRGCDFAINRAAKTITFTQYVSDHPVAFMATGDDPVNFTSFALQIPDSKDIKGIAEDTGFTVNDSFCRR